MWTKQQTQTETPPAPPPLQPAASPATVVAFGATQPSRSAAPTARSSARLGSSLRIEGRISGAEDLQIDGNVDGPISLDGHQLTIGPGAVLKSELKVGAAVVYGKVVGNLYARDRVDIKTDGSVVGDISTARISIEDGAHFKGRIEIDPAKSQAAPD